MAQAYPLCSSPSPAFCDITTRISSSSYSLINLKFPNFPRSRKLYPLNSQSKPFLHPPFSSSQDTVPQLSQAVNSLEDAKLDDPDAKSSPLSKTHICVNPRNPKAKRHWKNSHDTIPSLAKLVKSLNSCHPSEQHVSEILKGNLGDNVTERDAVLILNNMVNPDNALFVFKYLQKFESVRHVILYNVTMKLFRETGEFERAEKLFDEMLQRGVKPDLITFSTMISCAALCFMPHKAIEWFEMMPSFECEPNGNLSSFMIPSYARTGNVDMALKLYRRAIKEKWQVKTAAFSSLIKMYGMLGNYDGCLSVYNDMKALGTKPNMVMYNALLYAMGRAKRAREAKAIYKEMERNGFSPNWATYAALLEAYSKARFSKDALIVYKAMKEKGMVVNKVLYSMLLDMCADVGYADEAVEIFEDMKRSGTCQPDSFIYSSLINMYACSGKVSEAEAMLNEMISCGFELNDMISCGFEPNIFVLTMFVLCYGKAKRTDDVVNIFNQFWDLGISPNDRLCDCLLYVMTQIPKQEHGKITDCIEKANPKLDYVVSYLMEEKESDGDFRKEALELLNSVDDDVKKDLCNSLIDLCVSLGVQHRARDLLNLGLTLEIYKDIQSRSETQWSLHLKKLSVGAAMTALHVWIDELSKAFELGEEVPPQLGICTGPSRHYKRSDKELASVFESYLKELNAPFHKATNMAGCFLTTNQEAKSWLQSRGSTETVPTLQASQALNSLQDAKLENPVVKSSALSKAHIWVNPKSPRAKQLLKNSYFDTSSLVKLAESLDSCDPNEQHVSQILKGLGDNVTERDAVLILNNLVNPDNVLFVFKYFQHKFESVRHVILYNMTMMLFRESREFERAEKLFDEMLQRGVKPNLITFSTMISCAALCSMPHKAVEWFEMMPSFECEPDDNLSSSMISYYACTGNVDMALKLYDRAKKDKWHIDTVSFSTLIKMYGKSGNYDGCISVYNDIKVLGAKPNVATYNNLLRAMGKAKRAWKAKAIYEEMKNNGISPNQSTYVAVLRAYCKGRYKEDALIVYKEMKEKGKDMDSVLYNLLLDMCAVVGYADEAVEIFEDMKRSGTCQPNIFIYSSLINMYACSGKVSEAEAMLNEMISCGLEPDILVLTMFVHCYGKAKRTDDVVKIFNQFWDLGISPDDRLCDCLLYVMTQIPKQEHGKITDCIEKANPKLGYVVRYLMEEKEGDGDFKKEASELLNSVDDDVKKFLCNRLIDLCVNLGVQHRARDLLDLGLTLEIYKDLLSRSETQWSLHLKKLSVGAAMTALHVWIDELSKAFELGEEVPPQLGICTGPSRHYKRSDKEFDSVFESYLKELNAPFHKATNMAGWFLTTNQEAKSWMQSRGSNETVVALNSPV